MNKTFLQRGLIALVMVLGFFSIYAQSQKKPVNFSKQINGQIRYAESRTPAENVLVRLEGFGGGLVDQIITDKTGKFLFNGLSNALYIVTIHTPGYNDITEQINLVTQNTSYIDASLIQSRDSIRRINSIQLSPSVIDASIPQEARIEFQKGKDLLDQGKKDKINIALTHFEKALQISPKFLDAQLLLGLAYMDLQQWDKAEAALKTAIEINANATTAYLALGEVYRRQKKYADAEKTLLDGVKINDSSAEIHNELAKVYWEMAPAAKTEQEFKLALGNSWKEVRRAIQLNAKMSDAQLLAGNLMLKAGRGKDALGYFEDYLKLEPKGTFAEPTQELVKRIKSSLTGNNKNK